MRCSIVLFLISVFSTSAFSTGLFQYKMVDLPISLTECDSQMDAWKERFEKQTQREVYNLKCVARTSKRSDIFISYVSAKELELVSTVSDRDYFYAVPFKTEKSCLADLNLEIENFRKFTGLEPFIAYCGSPSSSTEPSIFPSFGVRIESFGEPKLYPFTYYGMVLPKIEKNIVELQNKISSLKNTEIQVSRVRFVRDVGGHGLFLHYYSKQKLCMKFERLFRFYEKDACVRYEEVIQEILTKKGSAQVLGFVCGPFREPHEAQLLYAHPKVVYWVNEDPKEYASHRLCESSRSSVVTFHREVLKERVLDGFCQMGPQGKFVISLIGEREYKDGCY